mmetsp:Transcript_17264/g.56422  ORF Transcript_17264/g.56422 Transcript_17264/m.56422 type:complete len:422 (-) Transcript_17264:2149-3414(-)
MTRIESRVAGCGTSRLGVGEVQKGRRKASECPDIASARPMWLLALAASPGLSLTAANLLLSSTGAHAERRLPDLVCRAPAARRRRNLRRARGCQLQRHGTLSQAQQRPRVCSGCLRGNRVRAQVPGQAGWARPAGRAHLAGRADRRLGRAQPVHLSAVQQRRRLAPAVDSCLGARRPPHCRHTGGGLRRRLRRRLHLRPPTRATPPRCRHPPLQAALRPPAGPARRNPDAAYPRGDGLHGRGAEAAAPRAHMRLLLHLHARRRPAHPAAPPSPHRKGLHRRLRPGARRALAVRRRVCGRFTAGTRQTIRAQGRAVPGTVGHPGAVSFGLRHVLPGDGRGTAAGRRGRQGHQGSGGRAGGASVHRQADPRPAMAHADRARRGRRAAGRPGRPQDGRAPRQRARAGCAPGRCRTCGERGGAGG